MYCMLFFIQELYNRIINNLFGLYVGHTNYGNKNNYLYSLNLQLYKKNLINFTGLCSIKIL